MVSFVQKLGEFKFTIFRKLSQLTSCPLWASANTPWAVWTTNGWQLTSSDAADVEYLKYEIAWG